MNKIPNRQAICEVLMDKAKEDKDIMVLCSDSRGSASMTPFADNFPDQLMLQFLPVLQTVRFLTLVVMVMTVLTVVLQVTYMYL